MTHRERMLAVLRYQPYDRLPVVHFGYWTETLAKWAKEGHIPQEYVELGTDGEPIESAPTPEGGQTQDDPEPLALETIGELAERFGLSESAMRRRVAQIAPADMRGRAKLYSIYEVADLLEAD